MGGRRAHIINWFTTQFDRVVITPRSMRIVSDQMSTSRSMLGINTLTCTYMLSKDKLKEIMNKWKNDNSLPNRYHVISSFHHKLMEKLKAALQLP
ncbi:hypothetical protein AVEN_248386-1 [Araneus ventricosus]|uniref:Uncharacterized protein n=1 Tax=Araneus ventricosus TaxID=182803 RepID=A0A4Y2BP68_ARAVE|nr:hypothetical protein AVEN_248386-1 [Araneus ventricosus]